MGLMKNKFSKRAAIIVSLSSLFICVIVAVGGISAYFTDIAPVLENNFTVALDATCVLVEKYPHPDDNGVALELPTFSGEAGTIADFEKAVQVINTGYIDEYVRVKISFTESAIANKTQFSWDGTNFYWADPEHTGGNLYINNLPSGWVYNEDDGFYYYTKIVESGDWESIKSTLVGDEFSSRYFYDEGDEIIENDNMITPPLIRWVKTNFKEPKEMHSYGVNVIAECCPFYAGSNYADAWNNYCSSDF